MKLSGSTQRRATPLGLLLAGLTLAACELPPAPAGGDGGVFIAFETHFEGYQGWPSVQVDGHEQGAAHLAGSRTVYISERPPAGATEFPVGTRIVKEMNDGSSQVFAMVKRGGGYNLTGAVNWEWFELELVEGRLAIRWRGVGPPAGESYGGDPNGGCNGCHRLNQANDYVGSISLDGGS